MKLAKTEVLRVRVEAGWKNDLFNFAEALKLDVADIVRLACSEFVAKRKPSFTGLVGAARGEN